MKVFLLGFGTLALGLLEGLLESSHCDVVGVFPWSSALKSSNYKDQDEKLFLKTIDRYAIPKIEAMSVNDYHFIQVVNRLAPDIILVGSWGEKFSSHLFNLPGCQIINCHPSLLPKHRGASPYVSAIKEGDKESGITFHVMTSKIDGGPLLLQKSVEITSIETGESLKSKSGLLARTAVGELIAGLLDGKIYPQPQNEALASSYPPVEAEDGLIQWDDEPERIERSIRAMIPWVQSYGYLNGKRLIRFYPLVIQKKDHECPPGTVIEVLKNGVIHIASTEPDIIFSAYKYEIHNGILFLPPMLSRQWAKVFVKPRSIIG